MCRSLSLIGILSVFILAISAFFASAQAGESSLYAPGVGRAGALGPVDAAILAMTPERRASLLLQKDHRAAPDVVAHAWARVSGQSVPSWPDCLVESALREVMTRERTLGVATLQ